jgi:Baseplate J-like protein
MSAIIDPSYTDDRADALEAAGVNGMRMVLVKLISNADGPHAQLDLLFWNTLHLAEIVAAFNDSNAPLVFRIRGGSRIVGGSVRGQVHVAAVQGTSDPKRLRLSVSPIGDYSTYTLELLFSPLRIDPFFASLPLKFRPGCFSSDCVPPVARSAAAKNPAIDYLVKDYDSFRHTLMAAMAARVPGWTSTSEADHDQVLIDLFAAAADELSDYQDRVANEAYFATARKRVSLVRHARLMDYHAHEGNQASTWIAVDVQPGLAAFTLEDEPLVVSTASEVTLPETISFASREHRLLRNERVLLDPRLNRLRLHTWRNAQPSLRAGSTSADLILPGGFATEADAQAIAQLVVDGRWRQLLILEALNPLTGQPAGRDARKRQRLQLLSGESAAQVLFDPVVRTWVVRVAWRQEDALRFDFTFTTFRDGTPVEDVSMFYGNLLPMYEGRPITVHFHEAETSLPFADQPGELHRVYERWDRFGNQRDWVFASLPDEGPLAYLPPVDGLPPTGELACRSTLHVQIEDPSGELEDWDEVESLVHSGDSTEQGDHFMVETDERRRSVLRFGNGTNGRLIASGSVIHARYQIGGGQSGNVGADRLIFVQPLGGTLSGAVTAAFNPFDVTDGRDPEAPEKIRRNAPEAFRTRQLRAVTLADYVRRAEEVPGVARAVARYAWTGSWRTVRVAIDPVGFVAAGDEASDALWANLQPQVAAHLEAVRLIGEDLEIRPPRYVPLDIDIVVCAAADAWREDVRALIEDELSDGYAADGQLGLFHPDGWTFGQPLHRSVIEGRLHAIAAVEHVISISMRRFDQSTPGAPDASVLEMAFDEVLLLANDPDHLQRGRLRLQVQGGRQ